MKEIKAYIRPNAIDAVVDLLEARPDAPGVTFVEVKGFGHPKGGGRPQRLERVKLETVVPDSQAGHIADMIADAARTGNFGDGKIFVSDVEAALRIRTGERGKAAVTFPEDDGEGEYSEGESSAEDAETGDATDHTGNGEVER